jgi:hypothetical protein
MTTRKPCREQRALPTVADSAAEDDVLRISGPCQIFRPQTNSNLTGIRSDELGMSVVSPNSPLNNEVSKANKIYVPDSGSAVRICIRWQGRQGGHQARFCHHYHSMLRVSSHGCPDLDLMLRCKPMLFAPENAHAHAQDLL